MCAAMVFFCKADFDDVAKAEVSDDRWIKTLIKVY